MVDCLLTILVNQICRLFSTHQTPDSIITPPKPEEHVLRHFAEPKNTSNIEINIFSSINIHIGFINL
jgi:hypothetical protein